MCRLSKISQFKVRKESWGKLYSMKLMFSSTQDSFILSSAAIALMVLEKVKIKFKLKPF